MFLRNVGVCLRVRILSQPRTTSSSPSLRQISQSDNGFKVKLKRAALGIEYVCRLINYVNRTVEWDSTLKSSSTASSKVLLAHRTSRLND